MGYDTTATKAMPPLRRTKTCPAIIVDSSRGERKKRRRNSWSAAAVKETAGAVPIMADRSENGTSSTGRRPDNNEDYYRKAEAILKGGAMVGVGLVMIPLPVPMGVVVAGAGLSVLGKEFPAAQRFLDNTRGAFAGVWSKKEKVEEQETKDDKDFSVTDFDYSHMDEVVEFKQSDDVISCSDSESESTSEEEIIFSSMENSEVAYRYGNRRPLEETMVNVWNA